MGKILRKLKQPRDQLVNDDKHEAMTETINEIHTSSYNLHEQAFIDKFTTCHHGAYCETNSLMNSCLIRLCPSVCILFWDLLELIVEVVEVNPLLPPRMSSSPTIEAAFLCEKWINYIHNLVMFYGFIGFLYTVYNRLYSCTLIILPSGNSS